VKHQLNLGVESRVQKSYLFVPYRLLQVTTLGQYEFGYSAVHGFWPVKETADLAVGPTGCGDLARGGCLFAWKFNATRSTVFTEAEREGLDQTDAVAALVTRT